jgi:hypothetical protein
MTAPLIDRKQEWKAELRFLRREHSNIGRRIEELEEILRLFFPEERAA